MRCVHVKAAQYTVNICQYRYDEPGTLYGHSVCVVVCSVSLGRVRKSSHRPALQSLVESRRAVNKVDWITLF